MQRYEIRVYQTEQRTAPFQDWIERIDDAKAKTALAARVARAEAGNFGDWKAISGVPGLCEMRVSYGSGFRIYYAVVGRTVVLLLAGSTKQDQDRTIERAKDYLCDYKRRTKP